MLLGASYATSLSSSKLANCKGGALRILAIPQAPYDPKKGGVLMINVPKRYHIIIIIRVLVCCVHLEY